LRSWALPTFRPAVRPSRGPVPAGFSRTLTERVSALTCFPFLTTRTNSLGFRSLALRGKGRTLAGRPLKRESAARVLSDGGCGGSSGLPWWPFGPGNRDFAFFGYCWV
jgi:hypothetical protein